MESHQTAAAASQGAMPLIEATISSQQSSSWLSSFGWLIWSLLYLVIRLVTITIPTFLFTLFSTTWTVTMNATTLVFIFFVFFLGASWVVRYRFLNVYSRLPHEPQRKEPQIDLFPDTQEGGPKAPLSYLDEFLSAIKIFGYLERPVFHELTRSMQTRKLIAGETLNLVEEKGFCIVVDGLVEIFVKSRDSGTSDASPSRGTYTFSDEEDVIPGQQRYQLLTEVRNGASMSSLFSIMSLFTEDIPLRYGEDDASVSGSMAGTPDPSFPRCAPAAQGIADDPQTHAHAPTPVPVTPSHTPPSRLGNSPVPPMSLSHNIETPHQPPPPTPKRPKLIQKYTSTSAHPDIIARATTDTTIAIIPASAFRRLIKVYPKATTHIVHVILTRFQRVTLAQAYNYLGLTQEVLQTEKCMMRYTMCQLPNILRGDALTRLKEKFKRERERAGAAAEANGIALHNAGAGRRRRSSTSLRQEAALQSVLKQPSPLSLVAGSSASLRDRTARQHLSPGDLLGDAQMSHRASRAGRSSLGYDDSMLSTPEALRKERTSPLHQGPFEPFGRHPSPRPWHGPHDSVDEDNLFRVSVLECMFKALGLGMGMSGSMSRDGDSVPVSPRLISYDQRRQKAIFSNNAFGLMGPYDGSADGETESQVSAATAGAMPNLQMLPHEMRDDVEIVFFPKGSVLVDQGERSPGLYYVIDGFLDIGISSEEVEGDGGSRSKPKDTEPFPVFFGESAAPRSPSPSSPSSPTCAPRKPGEGGAKKKKEKTVRRRRSVAMVKPGGLAPYVSTVSSCRSFIDVVARTDVYVGFLPRASLERVVDRYPIILLTMAKRLTSILPRLILHIDFALEWVQVNAGEVIFHDGDESDAIYIVLNGRLRLVADKKDGGVAAKAEFGQGESVGELEVLTESSRTGTLHAIRDTEVVKFPHTLFNSLAQEHPNITIKISKIIASRMRSLVDDPSTLHGKEPGSMASSLNPSTVNIRTVAILPVTAGVPIVEFGNRLMNALAQVSPPNRATSLNQSAILNHLGKHAFNRIGRLRLSQYLADLEEKYGLVVYVADTNVNSPWTQTCITQADCVLLVGLAEGSPEIGEYERFMLGMKSTARKTLVLIHTDRFSSPGVTRSWLRNRMWINGGHHHVQMSFMSQDMPMRVHPMSQRISTVLRQRVQTIQAEIFKYTSRKVRPALYPSDAPSKGDLHRLARRLCGKSVGLVLGGGGARGITQIGIIRAMEEEGIPVDIVGGTSIGAFIGALYARHADVVPIYGLAKKFAGRMASIWRFALDLTYPSASYTTGHEFNRGIFKTFGNHQIEDFWLDYYCNTTNISKSRQEFHNSGYAWRYIRASMSLAGLLPPLCDEGSMLLDGGYMDNLTVSHMKALGAHMIFAVDVGAIDDDVPQTYGDSLSGIWSVVNRWNPFSPHANPPTLAEIQGRLAYVSSFDALERAKAMPGCVYMRPPIDAYGTLDFGKFDEIYQVGYEYGKTFLRKLREDGVLPLGAETEEAKQAMRRTMGPRRASI